MPSASEGSHNHRDPSTPLDFAQMTIAPRSSFFNYLGVFDHCHPTALGDLAFDRDVLATILRELAIHRLVFAHNQISFAIAHDADWAPALDAFGPARLAVLFAHGVMIDIAHHVYDFAGHYFRSGRVFSVFVLLSQRHRPNSQCPY